MAKTKKSAQNEIPIPKNAAQYRKLYKKGHTFYLKKDYVTALQYLTKAWKFDATDVNLLVIVADSLFHIDKKNTALQLMTHALETNPTDPGIVSSLGNAALGMNFFDLAQAFHKIYISLKPNEPIGYNNYATALREDGKYDEAIELLQDVLPIFPKSELLWNTLGSIVSFRDGPGHAIIFYEECLKINPKNDQALNNIAPSYFSVGQIDKAEEAIRASINLSPNTMYQHMFLSNLLLQTKRLTEGWDEYRWSHYGNNFDLTVKHNNIPYWNGEDLKGKKIFVFAEQGIGDEILFSWLYKNLIRDAEKVGIACQKRLLPLFRNSFPEAQVERYMFQANREMDIEFMVFPDFNVSEFDYQCTAGEIARYYWKEYEDIEPNSEPILIPTKEKIDHWRKEVEKLSHDISVGIAWRSGVRFANRARNYAELMDWVPILKQKNINFVNVQYGDCQAELDELESKTGIKIHNFKDLDLKDDFDGTTAMMQSLDLVMGPASAPLMQSTLSGVESWYFLSKVPFWTFGDEYPRWQQKARILAKSENEPWGEHMVESAEKFKKWVKTKRK